MENNKKILVVDDEDYVSELVVQTLKIKNYDVITAVNGKQALDKVMSEKPGLIILDITMPDMNGIEFIDALFETAKTAGSVDYNIAKVPIIVLSGQTDKTIKLYFDYKNVADYITKPFNSDELLRKVEECLQ